MAKNPVLKKGELADVKSVVYIGRARRYGQRPDQSIERVDFRYGFFEPADGFSRFDNPKAFHDRTSLN
jgi:hypothetical protein